MIMVSNELLEDAGIIPYYTTEKYKERGIKGFMKRLFKRGGWIYYQTFHRAWNKHGSKRLLSQFLNYPEKLDKLKMS